MQTRSNDYLAIFTDANHRVEWRVTVNGMVYGEDKLIFNAGSGNSAPKLSRSLLTGNQPEVGTCIAGTFNCAIIEASSAIPRMATVIPAYRLVLQGTEPSEWITLGTFYIDTRQTDKATGALMLNCYDRMLVADGAGGAVYADLTHFTSWPQSMSAVVNEIASLMTITLDPRTIIQTGPGYTVDSIGELTMRETLGYIAAAHGGNWTITPENKLRLIPLTGGSDDFDLGANAADLKTSPALPLWTGVDLKKNEDTVYEAGNKNGRVLHCECPWATQDTANGILAVITGTIYQPYTATGAIIDLALELGDNVTVGLNGDTVSGPAYSIDVAGSALEQADIAAPGDSEMDHEYPYLSPVNRRIKRIQEQMDSIDETIEDEVQTTMEIAMVRAQEMDFSQWDEGTFSETLDNGEIIIYEVDFDNNGRPIRIVDGLHECEIVWE